MIRSRLIASSVICGSVVCLGAARATATARRRLRVDRLCGAAGRQLGDRARHDYDIGVVRLSDKTHTDVARSAGYDGMYAWSPDSMHLAFVSARDGFDALYRAAADGRHVQRLTDTPALNPAWARGR